MDHIITSESRLFQLDFGWIDFYFSIVFFCYLFFTKRKRILIAGNIFGAFAFIADYVLYYFIQRSRTIEYPENHTPMTASETFFFFFWFDWINGADIVMWALLCLEGVDLFGKARQRKLIDNIMIVFVPLWFWLTPWLSRNISQDDRVLLATRPSEKYKYYFFFVLFIPLLHLERRISIQNIGKVLLSGVGCGFVHHAPLFFWGMRGYTSFLVLGVTLLTEWPSIMCGLIYFTHRWSVEDHRAPPTKREKARGKSRRGVILALLCLFVAIFVPKEFWESIDLKNLEIDKQFYKLLPYMSAQTFQQIGTALVWTMTCSKVSPLFTLKDADCFESPEYVHVIATTAKGGSILGAKLALTIGKACGRCVGAGQRDSDAWPGPVESNPDYPSDILLAIANMRHWPLYVAASERPMKCVVVTRHPLSRLRSLYLYARNGGEKWFIDSGVEKRLDLPMMESVSQFIEEFGKDYLIQSHSYLMNNIEQGCLPIKFERLRLDFNNTMSTWLQHWDVKEGKILELLVLMQSENPLNVEKLGTDHHITTSKYSEAYTAYVNGAIEAYNDGSIIKIIKEQASELRYEMSS